MFSFVFSLCLVCAILAIFLYDPVPLMVESSGSVVKAERASSSSGSVVQEQVADPAEAPRKKWAGPSF